MGLVVIVNEASGPDGRRIAPSALREAFAAARVPTTVAAVPPPAVADRVRAALARRPEGVVVGGGDGTVSTAAGLLADTGVPFGVLPLGTRNQFARSLGMPLDPVAACRTIAGESPRAVDLACANDRTYVNHTAIGLYPHFAIVRDELRVRLGRGRVLATLAAFVRAFHRFPLVDLALETAGRAIERTTPFAFVGNDPFEFDLLSTVRRPSLQAGALGVYTTRRAGRFGLLGLMLRALLGTLDQARDFDAWTPETLVVRSPRRALRAVVDGELVRLETPVTFRTRPGALRVLAPLDGDDPGVGPGAMAGGT